MESETVFMVRCPDHSNGQLQSFLIKKYWCPVKIFGDFRDFYFLGQPIYWMHK